MIKSNYVITGALAAALVLPGVVLGGNDTVKVKSGDTLSEIASANGMSVGELKSLNKLKSNTVYVNQVLKVSGQKEVNNASTGTITNASYVNIRTGPGVSHKSIKALQKGTKVTIHSEAAGWSLVSAENVKGYVTSSYIEKGKASANAPTFASGTGVVTGAYWLNVRSGAGMNYESIATLKNGTKVDIHSNTNGWYAITAGDVKGYAASGYIQTGSEAVATAPAPAAKKEQPKQQAPKPAPVKKQERKVEQAAPATQQVSQTKGLARPTETSRITSTFGSRWNSFHYGTDYAEAGNQKILAAADGTVSRSFTHKSLGEVVFIKHTINGKTIETVYGHMKTGSRAVKKGDKVSQGQFIGWMGSTGHSTGQHLHFEVHPGGYKGNASAVDPSKYVK